MVYMDSVTKLVFVLGAFALFVWLCTIAFKALWNHLFHYVLSSVFNYELPVISNKQSLAILVMLLFIHLLFIRIWF